MYNTQILFHVKAFLKYVFYVKLINKCICIVAQVEILLWKSGRQIISCQLNHDKFDPDGGMHGANRAIRDPVCRSSLAKAGHTDYPAIGFRQPILY